MGRFRRRGQLAVLTAPVVMAAFLLGCTSWRPHRVEPRRLKEARVTLTSGTEWRLYQVAISYDSLVGMNEGRQEKAFPIAEVREVVAPEVNVGKTLLVLAGVGVGAAGVILVLQALVGGLDSSGY